MPANFETGVLFGESAWHGLGTVIPRDDDRRYSISECIRLAELDWEVVKAQAFYYMEDGEEQHVGEVPGQYVTMRRRKDGSLDPLGVVGSKYTPLQNLEAFEWFQRWLDTKEVSIETAGSLENGRCVWVLARINREAMEVVPGDPITEFLQLSTRHDGQRATETAFTGVRTVCTNTMSLALRTAKAKLSVRHTASQKDSLDAIRESVDLMHSQFVANVELYRKMATCGITTRELRQYVKLVNDIPVETPEKAISSRMRNRLDKMVDLAINGRGQSGISDLSVWSAYNGVTEYVTHFAGSDAEKRLKSNMFGAYAELNKKALDIAIQLAS